MQGEWQEYKPMGWVKCIVCKRRVVPSCCTGEYSHENPKPLYQETVYRYKNTCRYRCVSCHEKELAGGQEGYSYRDCGWDGPFPHGVCLNGQLVGSWSRVLNINVYDPVLEPAEFAAVNWLLKYLEEQKQKIAKKIASTPQWATHAAAPPVWWRSKPNAMNVAKPKKERCKYAEPQRIDSTFVLCPSNYGVVDRECTSEQQAAALESSLQRLKDQARKLVQWRIREWPVCPIQNKPVSLSYELNDIGIIWPAFKCEHCND